MAVSLEDIQQAGCHEYYRYAIFLFILLIY
jgi:hypothetical protein